MDSDLKLSIYPKGHKAEFKDFLGIFMTVNFDLPVQVSLKVSLIDQAGKEKHSHAIEQHFKKSKQIIGSNWGWPNFISRDVLFLKKNGLVKGNTLNLAVEIDFKKDMKAPFLNVVPAGSAELESLKQLYRERKFTDITILVQGKYIRAHKVLLAEKSSVLHEKLICNENQNILELKDLGFDVLEGIIEFIYEDKIGQEKLEAKVKELIEAAEKYKIESLKKYCLNFLVTELDPVNAVEILKFISKHSYRKMEIECIKMISKYFHLVKFALQILIN